MKEIEKQDQAADNEKLLRMRYYKGRKNTGEFRDTFIQSPQQYWLSSNLFSIAPDLSILIFTLGEKEHKNASSILTIFSIWNCMIGSGVVSLPNVAKQAGIIPFICKILNYIVFNILFFFLCFYTCNVISKTGGHDNDYSGTVHSYLVKKYGYMVRVLQIVFSIAINLGGDIFIIK
jgi:hypothetical protein